MCNRIFATLAALLLATFPLSAASGVSSFDWQGTCTLAGTASGLLTPTEGSSPFSSTSENFVSFQFTSSSGTFVLDNSSPFLSATGGSGTASAGCNVENCSSLLLEQNALGPNILPLCQFVDSTNPLPLTLSSAAGGWQFLSGSYFYQCLDANCTTWTDDVIRNAGVPFAPVATGSLPVPGPIVGAGLPAFVMAFAGFIGWRRS
jgi:hypothetical protein